MGDAAQAPEEWRETLRATLSLAKWGGGKIVLVEVGHPADVVQLNDELTALGLAVSMSSADNSADVFIRVLANGNPEYANEHRARFARPKAVALILVPPSDGQRLLKEAPDLSSWVAASIRLPSNHSDFTTVSLQERFNWTALVISALSVAPFRSVELAATIVAAAAFGLQQIDGLSGSLVRGGLEIFAAIWDAEPSELLTNIRSILTHADPQLVVELDALIAAKAQ